MSAQEALDQMAAFKKRGWEWPCVHPDKCVTPDGICGRCWEQLSADSEEETYAK